MSYGNIDKKTLFGVGFSITYTYLCAADGLEGPIDHEELGSVHDLAAFADACSYHNNRHNYTEYTH
jgi:hypothetical protein